MFLYHIIVIIIIYLENVCTLHMMTYNVLVYYVSAGDFSNDTHIHYSRGAKAGAFHLLATTLHIAF